MADNSEQFKNYRIGEIIGRGRFAVVYRAEKLDIRKTVALKVLNPGYANRANIRDQFREQARQQAKLAHARLVRVEDLREEHGQFFVAMEYMPLGSLGGWVTQNGMISFRQAAIITEDVAEALDYLHGRGQVHGDVKPGNILLMEDSNQKNVLRAKLSDLRLPLKAEVSQTVSDNLVEITPEYISPEQASGKQTTPLSDQYSLGVVVYEMLCGQPPFTNKSQVDLYIDHQRARPVPLQQLNDQVTTELEQVVLRALEKAPENRYPSCGEFARALRTAVAATEQKRLTALLDSAVGLLDKQEFEQARIALKDALLIQPENERALQFTARLDQQEALSKNYHQAIEALQLAEAKAQAIRKASSSEPDEAGLLKTFAPPPLPFWKQIAERWRSARQLTAFLLIFILICIASITFWIDTAGSQSVKPTVVALDRTSTRTLTPTFTPTFTPSVTLTFTPTLTPTLTSTPTLIGGGSGKIAFYSDRDGYVDIYIMYSNGSGQTNLTNQSGVASGYSPVWSPDSRKIAFTSENRRIYVINSDGSGLTNLSNNFIGFHNPVWSPDGKQIAFLVYDYSSGGSRIQVMSANGSGPTNLSNSVPEYDPIWSPDGKQIAFLYPISGRSQIFVMNADGSRRINLSNNSKNNFNPVWSPDGKKIAFVSGSFSRHEIYAMNIDGSGQTNLTNNSKDDSDPVWSPDGKTIAFITYRHGVNPEIYVMNADGSNPINLTNNSSPDYDPVFAPDGKKIAFVSQRDGNPEIYVMNVDGSNVTRLTQNDADDFNPVWSP